MADARLARARTTLPAGYQFGDAGRPAASPFLGAHDLDRRWHEAKLRESAVAMAALIADDPMGYGAGQFSVEQHRDAIEAMKRRWGLGR